MRLCRSKKHGYRCTKPAGHGGVHEALPFETFWRDNDKRWIENGKKMRS